MDGIIDGALSEPEWLEIHTSYWNLRVWHIIFFCFSGVISIGNEKLKKVNNKFNNYNY